MSLTIAQLNAAAPAEAVALLDGIYEHSPWIAERALAARPFRTVAHLKHAPEVIAEIERTVLKASPFPPATRLGAVTWTDTWLWDESGRFQLDTLTEGQQQGD